MRDTDEIEGDRIKGTRTITYECKTKLRIYKDGHRYLSTITQGEKCPLTLYKKEDV